MSTPDGSERLDDDAPDGGRLAEGSPRGADGLATGAEPDTAPAAPDPDHLAEGSPRGADGLATDA